MALPVAPEPNRGNVPVPSKGRNWLALTSFLLSFTPPVLVGGGTWFDSSPFWWVFDLISYIGCLLCGTGAVVTGILALRRAKQYPPRQAWRGLAIAGLTLGIVGTVVLVCGGAGFLLFLKVCSGPPGCL